MNVLETEVWAVSLSGQILHDKNLHSTLDHRFEHPLLLFFFLCTEHRSLAKEMSWLPIYKVQV